MFEELKFNISEIFFSIQGESSLAGLPCVFIRLQGCNMRCVWCDTDYSLDVKVKGQLLSIEEIEQIVEKYNCNYICVTGGEPLMQSGTPKLLSYFCEKNYRVSLETNGYYNLSGIDSRVKKVVDFKCPDSGMSKLNNFDNIDYITDNDEVKFVIASKEDYEWSKEVIVKYKLLDRTDNILMSVVFGKVEPKELAEWILSDGLKVRFQLQLHKFIWEPNRRGV